MGLQRWFAAQHKRTWQFLVRFFDGAGRRVLKVDTSARKRRTALVFMAALLGSSMSCCWGGSFALARWHGVVLVLLVAG